jgi:hypothetical protein
VGAAGAAAGCGVLADALALNQRRRRAFAAALAVLLAAGSMLVRPIATPAGASLTAHLVVAGPAGPGAAGLRPVSYRGYRFLVPRSWPVIRDARHPRGCVRFDLHAIYLGRVGSDESCPSWLLGTTEALLVQPGPATVVRRSTEDAVARQITVHAARISIIATFDTDPAMIDQILASAALPAPALVAGHPARLAAASAGELAIAARLAGASQAAGTGRSTAGSPMLRKPMPVPALPALVADYRGFGFDACAAPSRAYMRAWLHHSRYRAIGIYIGGADRACAQTNLSPGWVRVQARAGWRFIPLYAGPQAAFGELRAPVRQGTAAATDAVAQAQRLGFGPRTPIYYDMEAYRSRARVAALRFLSAWTLELHRLGYTSGVYSSSDSGIVDLARQYSSGRYAMPDIVDDALWNGAATTSDRNLRAGQWPDQHRIHQYGGNVTQTHGGDTINIDEDYLNVRVATPGGTSQWTSAVTLPGGSVDLFYRAHGHQLWLDRYATGSGWARPRQVGSGAWSVPSAVWTGSAVDVFFKGARGELRVDSYRLDGRPSGSLALTMMGTLGLGPRAVAQSGGVIDVFWRGSLDDHLWHGQFTPSSGWHGPQGLGGDLASAPSPVVSSPGTTAVFWKGTDGSLWQVTRTLRGRWNAPSSLGMAPLGGPPQATAQPGGAIEVYWAGSGNSDLWEAFFRPGAGWRGPRHLADPIRSAPWPVTAGRTVRVIWSGRQQQLTVVRHRMGSAWNARGWVGPVRLHMGRLGSAPFAAVGGPGAAVRVFWRGPHGRLWTASLGRGGWTGPLRLP